MRYIMSAGYAGKGIQDIQPTVDEIVVNWIQCLRERWSSTPKQARDFDIGKRIQFLTVDITTKLCLGESFRCVEEDRDQHAFLDTVKTATPVSLQLSLFPELTRTLYHLTKLAPIRRLLVPSAEDKSGREKGHQQTGAIRNDSSRHAGVLFEPGVAGSDTTSTAVQATLLTIITNPRVYHKLQKEIDSAVNHRPISVPIQEAEARQLPYLQACIQEGLRIHPPLAQLRDRVAPPEGDYIHGYRIPGGTSVGFNSWGTQRDPIYGDDAAIFRPERWVENEESRIKEMKQLCDLIFGHGPTKCLGSKIAWMILNKAIFETLPFAKSVADDGG
ncbi:MAG: hypothetical protein Q9205_002552 [Flavoplaca limonia]